MTGALAGARALICESLRLDEADPARLRAMALAANLEAALSLARTNAVLPTLAWTLARHGLLGSLPEGVRSDLGEALTQNTAQNALLLADLSNLTQAFGLAGVRFIVLKGAALMALDPRAIPCRQTDDIDLLVDQVDLYRARDCALALGYRQKRVPSRVDHAGDVEPLSHHLAPLLSPRGTPLELHFRLGPGERQPGRTPLLPGLRRVELRTSGATVFLDVPSATLLASHLASHVIVHHRALGGCLARHVQDLHLLGANEAPASFGMIAGGPGTPLEARRQRAAEMVGWTLARYLAAPLCSRRRHFAETLILSTGPITLARLLRPLLLITNEAPRTWAHLFLPSRAFLSQLYPEAAEANTVRLLALYARRLGRVIRNA
jgi:hypothetical protein